MKLIDPELVPTNLTVYEFRDISWKGLVYVGLAFSGMAALVLFSRGTDLSWGAAWIPLLPGILFFILAAARRKGAGKAWLMKSAPEGLYINTGYSDGYPLKDTAHAALFIPSEEVAGLACVMEVMRLPYRFGITRHHFSCLDIKLTCPVRQDIQKHLSGRQAYFVKSGKSGPYPVRLTAPGLVRLGWGWVQPGAKETVQLLSDRYPVLPQRNITYLTGTV